MGTPPLLGIFVGGASRRMGGYPKGLLTARDTAEPLVVRLARLAREVGLEPVWVGRADAYRALLPELRELTDDPAGVGPLGGLMALLRAARHEHVLAMACDMPHVSPQLLWRLRQEQPEASVLSPRSEVGLWEPLCARYRVAAVLPACEAALARGDRSFQALFATLPVVELPLSELERRELVDWDRPEDLSEKSR
ncbi:MAG: molybdenum cofactor guanylyltransferase [Myxococcales bacterium]